MEVSLADATRHKFLISLGVGSFDIDLKDRV